MAEQLSDDEVRMLVVHWVRKALGPALEEARQEDENREGDTTALPADWSRIEGERPCVLTTDLEDKSVKEEKHAYSCGRR